MVFNEQHAALIKEADSAHFSLDALRDRSFNGTVDVPPEGGDHRVGVPPGVDQWLQFFFGQSHFQGSH